VNPTTLHEWQQKNNERQQLEEQDGEPHEH